MADGWTIVIHGGSGSMARGTLSPADDAGARAGLARAIEAGSAILRDGGDAVDASSGHETRMMSAPASSQRRI